MTVKIRESDYDTAGGDTYPVASDLVRGHLMIIASGGDMEALAPSFGDEPDPSDPDYSIVIYDPSPVPGTGSPSERVRKRLKDLVDDTTDYQVVGVTADTVWSDGTTIEAQPARALGDTVFYDTSNCDGNGRWIHGVNGEQECTSSVGMLYHELAHAFRDHGLGSVEDEEAEAIDDENDLREAQGLVPRDRERIEGGCGCPDSGCCIVASVALGSPFAGEIQDLRRLRDHVLRSSALGEAFFDGLHAEYYAFSIDVCRIMVRDETARSRVEDLLVRPLVDALAVFRRCCERDDPAAVGRALLDRVPPDTDGPGAVPPRLAASCLECLASGAVPPIPEDFTDGDTPEILGLLADRLPRSPRVAWGVVGALQIWFSLLADIGPERDAASVGRRVLEAYERWMLDVPLAEEIESLDASERPERVGAFVATIVSDPAMERRIREALGGGRIGPGAIP